MEFIGGASAKNPLYFLIKFNDVYIGYTDPHFLSDWTHILTTIATAAAPGSSSCSRYNPPHNLMCAGITCLTPPSNI